MFTDSSSCSPQRSTGAWRRIVLLGCYLGLLLWPQRGYAQTADGAQPGDSGQAAAPALPVIHIPYSAAGPDPAKGAIFWFGKVDPSANHANVRMAYTDEGVIVVLHIFDRLLTYDENARPDSDLTQWDAVTLYVDTQADLAAPLQGGASYRFDLQLSHWQARTNYIRTFAWQGGAWQAVDLAPVTEAGFRGYPNDSDEDRGWLVSIMLPFTGLDALPGPGSIWRMALALHDRDAVTGGLLPQQTWPASAVLNQPATWGRIGFGMPAYTPPPAAAARQQLALRNGVNGVQAPDAAVGGHSECGAQFNPNFFNGWGDAKYPGYTQFNIQNQWDVADWPCFSKYYVTFPLDSLPDSAAVISATLTMYMFGNAGYKEGDAKPSFIQAARVAEAWDEQTLTWNNAPPVLENYDWTVVEPMRAGDPSTKIYTWDVARAVADAQAAGELLRLVLYSSDGDYHSGKYFWSADAVEMGRPVLNITWASQGYLLSATPIRAAIRSGETARYEVLVESLPAGETVTLQAGPSSPPGLEIAIKPDVLTAPGGKAVVTLTDRKGGSAAVVYTVPVRASAGEATQVTELTVLVNGQQLFLPAAPKQ